MTRGVPPHLPPAWYDAQASAELISPVTPPQGWLPGRCHENHVLIAAHGRRRPGRADGGKSELNEPGQGARKPGGFRAGLGGLAVSGSDSHCIRNVEGCRAGLRAMAIVSRWTGASGFGGCPVIPARGLGAPKAHPPIAAPHHPKGCSRQDREGGRVRTGGHLVAAVQGLRDQPGSGQGGMGWVQGLGREPMWSGS